MKCTINVDDTESIHRDLMSDNAEHFTFTLDAHVTTWYALMWYMISLFHYRFEHLFVGSQELR